MIKSLEDIKTSYDEERYKNDEIYNLRKKDLYDEHPKLKEYDFDLIDLYTDFSLLEKDRKEKIDKIKALKDKYIKDNNIDPQYDEPIYTCPICHDTGYVDGKKCKCFKEKELKVFSKISDFDKISTQYNFDKIDYKLFDQGIKDPNGNSYVDGMKNVVKKLKSDIDDIDDKPFSFLLHGPTGVGKTFIAKCIGSYTYSKGKTVLYISMPTFIDKLFNKHKDQSRYDIAEIASVVDLLILDDFGKEYNSEFTISRIYNIIDRRLEDGKSTVICTQCEKEDILDNYDDSIASRLYHDYTVFGLYGKDLRGVKR